MAKRPLFIYKRPQKGLIAKVIEHWQFWLTSILAIIGTWLVVNQNQLMENQNTLIERQMLLDEASRRSALVMLMSNIMDKVDDEIKDQKDELRIKGVSKTALDTMKFSLSQSLISQIAALSHSFKPYRYMEGDTLIERSLSPERGQLLITLSFLPLDTFTLHKIYHSATFENAALQGATLSYADLNGAKLNGASLNRGILNRADLRSAFLDQADLSNVILWRADLRKAHLRDANLNGADLGAADLRGAELNGADLSEVILNWANLKSANLTNANFSKTYLNMNSNLTIPQLSSVNTLFQSNGLPDSIKTELMKTHPALFEKPQK